MSDADRAFQQYAAQYLVARAPGRSRSTDRIYANGEDFCAAEDAAALRGIRAMGGRWRNYP